MRYVLGIHVGATRVTAAVCRATAGPWGPPEVVPLGGAVPWLDSVLHVSAAGELLAGEAAMRMAATEPERVAFGPLRRTGDPVPYVLGEVSYPAETLAAALIGWVADRVADLEGAAPERIVVTHPAEWSGYRRGLLHEALDRADLPGVLALPAPIAAAESRHAQAEVPPGGTLAVCRIGGTSVETALLRRGPRGFDLLTHAENAECGAGALLDDLLVRHVVERTGTDQRDPDAMARLRSACVVAKERLAHAREVHVTEGLAVPRAEFERLARPVLAAAVTELHRMLAQAPGDGVEAAVLVGGTAAVPLVRELAETMLDCPVAVDDDPATALARGAAVAARPCPGPRPEPGADAGSDAGSGSGSGELVTARHELPAVYRDGPDDLEPPPPRPPVEVTPLEPPKRTLSLRRKDSRGEDRR
ncbi:Hsp70 family protein [Prauserella oleivorans]|uniref:Hsp70 family protein n=1 Tax=Prauserella oleivorans TaxID=1478153 RepID=A0ABW5W640_9PSEU